MNELHLFAGAGGGILAGQLIGHRCVCAVEWEPYAQAVLVARQNDGTFPPFPVWDDVQTFDGKPWRGVVDVVCGGFPCQDISVAGNGAGIEGKRSGMWEHMARIIGEVRPRYVLVENSPVLTSRGLGRVLGDLASMGFNAQWGVLGAADLGAPHKRERIWVLAKSVDNAQRIGCDSRRDDNRSHDWDESGPAGQHAGEVADANCQRPKRTRPLSARRHESEDGCGHEFDNELRGVYGRPNCEGENMADCDCDGVQGLEPEPQPSRVRRQVGLLDGAGVFPAWPTDPANAPEPRLGRVVNGMAQRAHRIKAIGNGQVPRVAAAAFIYLMGIKNYA